MRSDFDVDGYEIEGLLGAGPTGETWLAREVASGTHVALHRIRPRDSDSADQARRLVERLTALNHPHVRRVRELLPYDDELVFVLNHVEGGSLEQLLLVRGTLDPGEVVTTAATIAGALAAAHDRGLVHGDLRPEDILFADDGTPLITDIGLGRIAAPADDAQPRAYADPAEPDDSDPTPAGDVYSLAAICYSALTGLVPRPGEAHRPLHQVAPGVPPGLAHAIQAGLQRAWDMRPHMGQFGSLLDSASRRAPVRLPDGKPAPELTTPDYGPSPDDADAAGQGPPYGSASPAPGPEGRRPGERGPQSGGARGPGRAGAGAGPSGAGSPGPAGPGPAGRTPTGRGQSGRAQAGAERTDHESSGRAQQGREPGPAQSGPAQAGPAQAGPAQAGGQQSGQPLNVSWPPFGPSSPTTASDPTQGRQGERDAGAAAGPDPTSSGPGRGRASSGPRGRDTTGSRQEAGSDPPARRPRGLRPRGGADDDAGDGDSSRTPQLALVGGALLLVIAVVVTIVVWRMSGDSEPIAEPTKRPTRTASPTPTVSLDPLSARWLKTLDVFDQRRANAFAHRDPDLLTQLYAPDSQAYKENRLYMVELAQSKAARVLGLKRPLSSLTTVSRDARTIVFEVVRQQRPYTVVMNNGERAGCPAGPPKKVRIEIVPLKGSTAWRISREWQVGGPTTPEVQICRASKQSG